MSKTGRVKNSYVYSPTWKNGGHGRPWVGRSAKKASLSRSILSRIDERESGSFGGRLLNDGKLPSLFPDIFENLGFFQHYLIRPNNFQKVHRFLESSRSLLMKFLWPSRHEKRATRKNTQYYVIRKLGLKSNKEDKRNGSSAASDLVTLTRLRIMHTQDI